VPTIYLINRLRGERQVPSELAQLVTKSERFSSAFRHFDVVLWWKVDRFGWSLKRLVNAARACFQGKRGGGPTKLLIRLLLKLFQRLFNHGLGLRIPHSFEKLS
jgi:hypothetical protein